MDTNWHEWVGGGITLGLTPNLILILTLNPTLNKEEPRRATEVAYRGSGNPAAFFVVGTTNGHEYARMERGLYFEGKERRTSNIEL